MHFSGTDDMRKCDARRINPRSICKLQFNNIASAGVVVVGVDIVFRRVFLQFNRKHKSPFSRNEFPNWLLIAANRTEHKNKMEKRTGKQY